MLALPSFLNVACFVQKERGYVRKGRDYRRAWGRFRFCFVVLDGCPANYGHVLSASSRLTLVIRRFVFSMLLARLLTPSWVTRVRIVIVRVVMISVVLFRGRSSTGNLFSIVVTRMSFALMVCFRVLSLLVCVVGSYVTSVIGVIWSVTVMVTMVVTVRVLVRVVNFS